MFRTGILSTGPPSGLVQVWAKSAENTPTWTGVLPHTAFCDTSVFQVWVKTAENTPTWTAAAPGKKRTLTWSTDDAGG